MEAVYHKTKIGGQLTDEERVERYKSFDIGLDAKSMRDWHEKRIAQPDEKGFYDNERGLEISGNSDI